MLTTNQHGQKRMLHVDINSYFATLLQQENPRLRGKPVGVVKSEGRTCIIAASKEAKKLGIKTGENLYDARKKAPQIITIPAAFELYLDATHRLKKVFHQFSPVVEVFSLDEAFLDMTDCEQLAPDLHQYGRKIQTAIKQELGEWVTCNVGIGQNKLLAKMAGEISSKGSVFEINQDNVIEILQKVEFVDVCGIGVRLERKLNMLGVKHPYMINFIEESVLQRTFGPFWSQELKKIAQGKETHFFSHIAKVDHMQSVGRTITGYQLTDDEAVIKRTLYNLLEEATAKIRKMQLAGRKVGVSLWGEDQLKWCDYKTLKYWVRHTNEIFPILYDDMYQCWERSFRVIKFGVWVGDLQPINQLSQSWLPDWQKSERIYQAMDKVNSRFGNFTLFSGALLGKQIIHPEVTGFLGDKIYHGL